MITDNKLDIFESFLTDRNLPKYAKSTSVYKAHQNDGNISEDDMSFDSGFNIAMSGLTFTTQNFDVRSGIVRQPGIYGWLKHLIYLVFSKKAPSVPTISVVEFFSSIKNSVKELELIKERANGYERAMLQAQSTGQTALLESLKKGLDTNRNESQLIAIESPKFLTEDDLIRFVKLTKRGLRLDWVKNFTRLIPADIVEKKIRLDELGIFDNYVVLHYDPEVKSWSETEAERIKRLQDKRDPILFGLMSGSRKLYFVGDWVDEKCDLTLEQIIDQIGTDVKMLGT